MTKVIFERFQGMGCDNATAERATKVLDKASRIEKPIDALIEVLTNPDFNPDTVITRKTREMSQATKDKRYAEQLAKLKAKYGIQ